MMSAKSPVRLNVTAWPAALSWTKLALGPLPDAVGGLPVIVAGQVKVVSPVLAQPMKPRPPPATAWVG